VTPPSVSRRATVLLLAICASLACVLLAAAEGAPPAVSQRVWLEGRLLEAVASVRAKHGLAPLRHSSELAAAALQHSTEMARDGYFAHNGNTMSYGRRLALFYPRMKHRTWEVGEILAWGSPSLSAGEALTMWLRSPEHRAMLLGRSWRDVGVAAVHTSAAPGVFGGHVTTVVTVDFGRH
jgi:uncharacterized protein YkwD